MSRKPFSNGREFPEKSQINALMLQNILRKAYSDLLLCGWLQR